VCTSCHALTPKVEPACCHCNSLARNELAWKVPLIIGMFAAAIVLSVILALVT
jgi:hypothetical protein